MAIMYKWLLISWTPFPSCLTLFKATAEKNMRIWFDWRPTQGFVIRLYSSLNEKCTSCIPCIRVAIIWQVELVLQPSNIYTFCFTRKSHHIYAFGQWYLFQLWLNLEVKFTALKKSHLSSVEQKIRADFILSSIWSRVLEMKYKAYR